MFSDRGSSASPVELSSSTAWAASGKTDFATSLGGRQSKPGDGAIRWLSPDAGLRAGVIDAPIHLLAPAVAALPRAATGSEKRLDSRA